MQKSPVLFLAALLVVFSIITSCQETKQAEKETKPAPPKIILEVEEEDEEDETSAFARTTYKTHCASCHEANIPTFIKRDWRNGYTWNEVHASIKNGHADIAEANFARALPDSAYTKLTNYMLISMEQRVINSFPEDFTLTGRIQSKEQTFRIDTLISDLETPWGLAFLPNNDLLVTDRNGKFYRYRAGEKIHPIKNVPKVYAKGQGGLLDVEVHPDFANNQTIYLSFSKPIGDKKSTTAVIKATLKNDRLIKKQEIWEAKPYLETKYHYGSRMEFDAEGYLFITIGDRAKRDDNPQSLNNFCGKIHRIKDDGSIPADNPFVNEPDAIASIWSYGHRNPQGLFIDKKTGIIWEHEHGPRGGDELNIIEKGKNFGWPVISYGINYSGTTFTDKYKQMGMEQPVFYYVPSIGPSGLTQVQGGKYPNWEGDLLVGSLRFQYISRLKMKDNKVVEEERLVEKVGRLREIKMGKDGYIYFTIEGPGRVMRIMPE